MNLRTKLNEWTDKTFGGIHRDDTFSLREQVLSDKEKNCLRNITVEFKKTQGYQKNWTSDEARNRWENEIKEILGGDFIKLEINMNEGSENNYIGGYVLDSKGKKEFKEIRGRLFHYQFKLEIIKKELRQAERSENNE